MNIFNNILPKEIVEEILEYDITFKREIYIKCMNELLEVGIHFKLLWNRGNYFRLTKNNEYHIYEELSKRQLESILRYTRQVCPFHSYRYTNFSSIYAESFNNCMNELIEIYPIYKMYWNKGYRIHLKKNNNRYLSKTVSLGYTWI